MASDSNKGTVRIVYKVDDTDLKKLDEGQDRIDAVAAAAASASPEIVALAEATKRASAAAQAEARALGLTIGEYRRVQREAAAAAATAEKEAASRAASEAKAAAAIQAALDKEASARAEADARMARNAEKQAARRAAAEAKAAAAIQTAADRAAREAERAASRAAAMQEREAQRRAAAEIRAADAAQSAAAQEVAARAAAEAEMVRAAEEAAARITATKEHAARVAAEAAEREARQQDRVLQASVNRQAREADKAALEQERLARRTARTQAREAKAAAAAQEKAARQAAAAAREAADETERAAGAAARGVTGIGQQLSDVASQLSTGTNPFTILVQQGPQIAGVAAEAGFGLAALAQGAALAAAGAASLAVVGVTLYGALSPIADAVGSVAGRLTGLELEPVTEAMEAQRRAAAFLAQSYADLAPILDDTREKQRELAVLTGQITEEQARLQKASEDAFGRYQESVEATRAKLAELKAAQAGVTTQMVDTAESIIPAWTPLGYALRNLTSSSEDYREEIMAGEAALQTQYVALDENVEVNRRVVAETEKAKEAEKARKEALKDSRHDLDALTRALTKFAEAQREAEAAERLAVLGLDAIGQTGAVKVYADLNAELEKLRSKQADVVAGLEEERDKALKAARSQQQRVQVISAANAAITAVEGQYAQERILASEQAEAEITAIVVKQEEERVKAAEQGLERRKKTADDQARIYEKGAEDAAKMADAEREAANLALRAAQQVADAIGEVFARQQAAAEEALSETQGNLERIQGLLDGLSTATVDAASLSGQALVDAYASGEVAAEDLTETQRSALERQLQAEEKAAKVREKAQKEAALAAWEAQHAAALASALINIPLAVSQTLGSVPYPANIPLAILAGGLAAAAAAEVASQEPPSFRAGYMPDQRLAYIEPQSEIVAPASAVQAMGGQQAARDAFAGMSPAPGAQKTVVMLGHRELNAMLINSAGRPGKLRDLTRRPGAGLRRPFG